MKKILILAVLMIVISAADRAEAQYYTFGLGPIGTVFAVDGSPEMDPGVGGTLFFDYRWSPQLSTQVSVIVTTQDGKNIDRADRGIELLGIPAFDIKYYVLTDVSKWDPYLMIGIGFYAISEGTKSNGTFAVGVGSNAGVGSDFYLTDKWSLGLNVSFKSIGLIDSTNSGNNGKAIFPVMFNGNVGYHF